MKNTVVETESNNLVGDNDDDDDIVIVGLNDTNARLNDSANGQGHYGDDMGVDEEGDSGLVPKNIKKRALDIGEDVQAKKVKLSSSSHVVELK